MEATTSVGRLERLIIGARDPQAEQEIAASPLLSPAALRCKEAPGLSLHAASEEDIAMEALAPHSESLAMPA